MSITLTGLNTKQIEVYLNEFIKQLSKQDFSEEPDEKRVKKIINIWKEINMSDNESNAATSSTDEICCYYLPRAKRQCDTKVSAKSVTGKYCSKHLKQEASSLSKEEKPEEDSNEKSSKDEKVEESPKEKIQCEYVKIRGDKERCKHKVSDKSTTGKYCSAHLKQEEKTNEPKPAKKMVETPLEKLKASRDIELNIYVWGNTDYVIDKSTKQIYAKRVDKKVVRLTDDDKEYLVTHKYEFDETLFPKE